MKKPWGWLIWVAVVVGVGQYCKGLCIYKMSKRSKRLFWVTLLLLALVFPLLMWGEGVEEVRYITANIDRGTIVHVTTAAGTVNPLSSVEVGTYVSGPVKEIYVDFNSPVRQGQVIAKIDPLPFIMKVRQAEAALAKAHAKMKKDEIDLKYKKLKLKRADELGKRKLLPQDDLDTVHGNYEQAKAQLELAKAEIRQAQATLQEAQVSLNYTDIVSPVNGIVISRDVNVGQTVAASFQTPILFLIAEDLNHMQVDTNVSEADIGRIQIGMEANFSVDSYPRQIFRGKVIQVRQAPEVIQNVVTYNAVVGVNNPDLKLKPGMTATVTFLVTKREDVLRVPNAALRFRPRGVVAGPNRVFVLNSAKTPKEVVLKLGLTDGRHSEVLDGQLKKGDAVLVGVAPGHVGIRGWRWLSFLRL